MAQGDTLTGKTSTENPIIFSEWKPVGKNKVQRIEYTFDSIVEGNGATCTAQPQSEQMDLFSDPYAKDTNESEEKHYLLVKWEYVYKQLVDLKNKYFKSNL